MVESSHYELYVSMFNLGLRNKLSGSCSKCACIRNSELCYTYVISDKIEHLQKNGIAQVFEVCLHKSLFKEWETQEEKLYSLWEFSSKLQITERRELYMKVPSLWWPCSSLPKLKLSHLALQKPQGSFTHSRPSNHIFYRSNTNIYTYQNCIVKGSI